MSDEIKPDVEEVMQTQSEDVEQEMDESNVIPFHSAVVSESEETDAEAGEVLEAQAEEGENLSMDLSEAEDVEGENLEAASDEGEPTEAMDASAADDSELDAYESADIEQKEFVDHEQMISIIESFLFASDKPQTINGLKQIFVGTNVTTKMIRSGLEELMGDYVEQRRGVTIEEVAGGYQLRTKVDNMTYLRRGVKGRPFKLSGPALEVLAITAYKQPCTKAEVDEIRGVESGHLMRGLMEKGILSFAGKSDLPGRPMLYQSTRKFLEIFGLRNLKELPSLSEIDDLIPEGIGDEEDEQSLSDLTDQLSETVGTTYSEGEEDLQKITDQLADITTSSDFFEQEKERQKQAREREKARDIEDRLLVDEEVSEKEKRWLERYNEANASKEVVVDEQAAVEAQADAEVEATDAAVTTTSDEGVVEAQSEDVPATDDGSVDPTETTQAESTDLDDYLADSADSETPEREPDLEM
ncbi:MAG: SMC-Scp complex subunit ScpB [Bdellovibrionaceae bacterium]|nr:SMC-Scp complex subunit ScpB [Pseudobdellovibrionaceae bacterium]